MKDLVDYLMYGDEIPQDDETEDEEYLDSENLDYPDEERDREYEMGIL